MTDDERSLTARQGVEEVRSAFVKELGWYPREPSDPDYGIDLYVECADDGRPNGRLIAVQVKSGSSFFKEETEEGVVFRGDSRHLAYWQNHSLPVVLVLYEPASDVSYWQVVNDETVHPTGKGWKVVVPRHQTLDANAGAALEEVARGDPYVLRLNQLRADLSWMFVLAEGGEVVVEVEEWVNKSSGRGEVRLIANSRDGSEATVRTRAVFWGVTPYAEVLPLLFPWASLSVDEEVYDAHEEDLWAAEEGVYDKEEGRIIMYGEDFDEWRIGRGLTGLRPYDVEQGELAHWRLCLNLNELGRGFLAVNRFLSGESKP